MLKSIGVLGMRGVYLTVLCSILTHLVIASPSMCQSVEGIDSLKVIPGKSETLATPQPHGNVHRDLAPTDPDVYIGSEACSTCHQAEYKIWAQTAHATDAYDLLRTSSNAKEYAKKLGIDEKQVENSPRCLVCHSSPQSLSDKRMGVVRGVTCESCHNPAGGEKGWLNCHSTYGYHVLRRENESAEHRQKRIKLCQKAGKLRSGDIYSLAKRCYSCHIVGDEELVVKGGHHPGNLGFEMTSWLEKGVRHNVFLNQHHNGLAPSLEMDPLWRPDHVRGSDIEHRRLMYVVSTLVDLELSLSQRARATNASFARAAATRIAAAHSRLTTITKNGSAEVLAPAVAAISEIEPILFMPPKEADAQTLMKAAELVADIAKSLSSSGNGKPFSAVDQFLTSGSK